MVLPVRDRLPTHRTAWVTRLLLLINIGVFVLLEPWSGGSCAQQAFFLEHAAIPNEIVEGQPLNAEEVAISTSPECGLSPVPGKPVHLAILSAMFLHAGWGHLLGNMLFLWIFGDNVEDRLGHVRFLAFYVIAGAVATIAFVLPSAGSPATLVGASGAIAAVLGAYLVMFPRSRITVVVLPLWFLPFALPAVLVLGFWIVLQVVEVRIDPMAGGGVAYLAHVAGFLVGMVFAWSIRNRVRPRVPPAPRLRAYRS